MKISSQHILFSRLRIPAFGLAFSCILFFILFFWWDAARPANVWMDPQTGDFSYWCVYPVDIHMNTDGNKVASSDFKMFLSWFKIVGIETLSGMDVVRNVGTGIAQKSIFSGMIYDYINAHQNSFASLASGSDIQIVRVFLMPLSWTQNTWFIDRYSLWSGINDEDSNISFGINLSIDAYPTHYQDLFYFWSGGIYSFNNLSCSGLMDFQIKVFPGSRSVSSLANRGEVRFYTPGHMLVHTWFVETDAAWFAFFTGDLAAWIYDIVYKWQSDLASYLSGVVLYPGMTNILDFTTGSNLSWTQNKSLSEDDGFQYQKAWDLLSDIGLYDYMVNGNDIAIIVWYGLWTSASVLHPANLNGDSLINASDIAVIGLNFEQKDIFFGITPLFPW